MTLYDYPGPFDTRGGGGGGGMDILSQQTSVSNFLKKLNNNFFSPCGLCLYNMHFGENRPFSTSSAEWAAPYLFIHVCTLITKSVPYRSDTESAPMQQLHYLIANRILFF